MKEETILLKEEITPSIISALMQNFRNPIDALLELVDNAVDDSILGQQTKIGITVIPETRPRTIKITNKGGKGMGVKELQEFLKWGESKKRGRLGRYGQGGKAAMGYLGESWEIICSKEGEEETYRLREASWRSRQNGLKTYKPEVYGDWVSKDEGMVSIEITGLERKVNKRRLEEIISDTYRVLLENGQVQIILNGEKVKPLRIPVVKREKFEEELPGGSKVSGWLGIREGKADGIKGGMRCYIFGRKIIDREYFGHPDSNYKASLNKLVGEIELNSVEPILNKTDLDRGSYEWEKAQEFMYRKIDPYVKALLGEEEPDLPSEKEIKDVRDAQKVFEQYLKDRRDLDKQRMMEGKGSPTFEDDYGQKEPESRQKQIPPSGIEREQRDSYQPATPPPLGAIGKRKRTRGLGTWTVEPFDEIMRSIIRAENGGKILVINNKFPLYKIRRKKGGEVDAWYIWETALMEYAKPEEGEKMTHQEYLEELGRSTLEFDKFLKRQSQKK